MEAGTSASRRPRARMASRNRCLRVRFIVPRNNLAPRPPVCIQDGILRWVEALSFYWFAPAKSTEAGRCSARPPRGRRLDAALTFVRHRADTGRVDSLGCRPVSRLVQPANPNRAREAVYGVQRTNSPNDVALSA